MPMLMPVSLLIVPIMESVKAAIPRILFLHQHILRAITERRGSNSQERISLRHARRATYRALKKPRVRGCFGGKVIFSASRATRMRMGGSFNRTPKRIVKRVIPLWRGIRYFFLMRQRDSRCAGSTPRFRVPNAIPVPVKRPR